MGSHFKIRGARQLAHNNLNLHPLAVFQTPAEQDNFLVFYPHGTKDNIVPSDGGSAVETTYSDGKVSVVSWSLNGAGHPTPSKKVIKGTRIGEKQNQDIEFAEVAWNFFKSKLNH